MPSGSFSKRARNTDSLVNRKNCGGNKKAGLAPRATGPTEFRNVAFNTWPTVNFKISKGDLPCPENYRNNPGGQCSGGVGALASTRNRGCNNLGNNVSRSNSNGGNNRETITLATARAQNGVRANQDLVLREADYETINDGAIVHREGLFIRSGESFTVAAGGTITFVDPISADGAQESVGIKVEGTFETSGIIRFQALIEGDNAFGIQVADSGEFTHSGGEITFAGELKSSVDDFSVYSFVYGILNNGKFTQSGGRISFQGAITIIQFGVINGISNSSTGTFKQVAGAITFERELKVLISTGASELVAGIDNKGSFIQQGGSITFKGKLTGQLYSYGIYNYESGSFSQEEMGRITFQETIGDCRGVVAGISNGDISTGNSTGSFSQAGTITFQGKLISLGERGITGSGAGIFNTTNSTFTTSGTITFEDEINNNTVQVLTYGINNRGSFIQQGGGLITFRKLLQNITSSVVLVAITTEFSLETDGTIEFIDGTYDTSNFDPVDPTNYITGNGSITYNNGTARYYPVTS